MINPTGYIDGEIAALDQIRVPVLDRGFLYGDSIYEVFRTYSGIAFLFEEHHQRLLNSARLIGMNLSQSKDEIIAAIRDTIAASGASSKDGDEVYVRYQITRGEGAVDLYPSAKLRTRLIVIVKPLPQWEPMHYQRGMTLAVPDLRRNAVNTLDPNIKGGNYLNNILGLTEARALGADECVMLDADGAVTECSNSNVWFVIDGKLATPAGGNLLGLTRKCLVDLLARAGHREVERAIHSDELAHATECFVTSATREVMPGASLRLRDGSVIEFPPGGGEMTRLAMRLYGEMLEEFVTAHRDERWF